MRCRWLTAAVAAVFLCASAAARGAPIDGIDNIQHVVVIMQENRSFDSYFGTYPGASGIPSGVCLPDPLHGGCVKTHHDSKLTNLGGPHGSLSATEDIHGGKMDGFVAQVEKELRCNRGEPECPKKRLCKRSRERQCGLDVMGYHDAREIPNYWTYAHDFVLQDNMFESVASWSLPEHLFLVSGWSAVCPRKNLDPMACTGTINPLANRLQHVNYAWTDITYLLNRAHVSWRYYVLTGHEPDCQVDESLTCEPVAQNAATPGIWNPLPNFADVIKDGQVGDVQSLTNFYAAVHEKSQCGLPNVAWIDPNATVSEHPPASIEAGQAYVTTLVNSIMRSPCWNSTAIFISWDDWGGFYDHVVPPSADENGYGLRVPGLVISPYARTGFIDHQQLSHDAYLKFIENDFLESARLNPATDGRPDPRTHVREENSGVGDLSSDFDFTQMPRAPVLLSPHPPPGPASKEP